MIIIVILKIVIMIIKQLMLYDNKKHDLIF